MCGVLQYVQDDDDHGPIRVVFSTLGVADEVAETDADEFRTRGKSVEKLKNLVDVGVGVGVRMCENVGVRVCYGDVGRYKQMRNCIATAQMSTPRFITLSTLIVLLEELETRVAVLHEATW